jgi:hypothetical protein
MIAQRPLFEQPAEKKRTTCNDTSQEKLTYPRPNKTLLHNPPPLLHPLLLRTHHLPISSQGRSSTANIRRLLHALESLVEPPRYEPGRAAGHLGVAGAALGVVLAAALVGVEGFEEAAVGGGGLWVWGLVAILSRDVKG